MCEPLSLVNASAGLLYDYPERRTSNSWVAICRMLNIEKYARTFGSFFPFSNRGRIAMPRTKRSKRKLDYRRIRSRRCYLTSEIADLMGVHPRTVQVWHRHGLAELEGSKNPYFFLGSEVRRFIAERTAKRRCRLNRDEFYCMKCKAATISNSGDIDFEYRGKLVGRSQESVTLTGKCRVCGARVVRFTTAERIEAILDAMINDQCQTVLKGTDCTALSADIEELE